MIKVAFGEDSVARSRIFEWFRHVKEGQILWKATKRPGRLLNEQEE
jgi:hypothetical protein